MYQDIYITNTDNSFLKALGPYRLDTASEPFGGLFNPEMENLTYTFKVGNITYHSTLQTEGIPLEIQSELEE